MNGTDPHPALDEHDAQHARLDADVADLKKTVGKFPVASIGDPGSGIAKGLDDVHTIVTRLELVNDKQVRFLKWIGLAIVGAALANIGVHYSSQILHTTPAAAATAPPKGSP